MNDQTNHGAPLDVPKAGTFDPYAELKAAHAAGKTIQLRVNNSDFDDINGTPRWSWPAHHYRIKPDEPEQVQAPTAPPADARPFTVRQITVSASRGFNHPHENFANFRFQLTVTADVPEGEDANLALHTLQREIETKAEQHKADILHDCTLTHEIHNLEWELENEERNLRPDFTSVRREKLTRELAEKKASYRLAEAFAPKIHPGHHDHPQTGHKF